MSIINDALKKAEREGNDKVSVPARGGSASGGKTIGVQLQRKKKGLNWGPVFVILVLLLITGPVIAPMFSTPFKREYPGSLRTPSTDAASYTVGTAGDNRTPRGQFGIEEMPRPMGNQPPGFRLTGLVYSAKESYCLINGNVVKQGEFIQGAKLVKVTQDEAVLDFHGAKIVLPVSSNV